MGTPVSGPGQFSQRTDKAVGNANASLPNANYGENKDFQEIKSGAPMASGGNAPTDIGSLMGAMRPEAIGLGEPSQSPDVPVTDGAALGAGAGPEVLGTPLKDPSADTMIAYLPALEYMANQPGSSDSARNLVRILKANSM